VLRPDLDALLKWDRDRILDWMRGKEDQLQTKLQEMWNDMSPTNADSARLSALECDQIALLRNVKTGDKFARFLLGMINVTDRGGGGLLF